MKEKINSILNDKKLMNQIFKFIIVGGIATVIDFAVLGILNKILGINYLIAAAFGFTVSVVYNYWASIKFVFDVDESKSKTTNFVIFIVLSIVGLGINELFMWLNVGLLRMTVFIGKVLATCVVMVFNFVTRKMFLEKHEEKATK